MRISSFVVAMLVGIMIVSAFFAPDSARSTAHNETIAAASNRTALSFIENVGQFDARVRFRLQSADTSLSLADDALWVTLFERQPRPAPARPAQVSQQRATTAGSGRGVQLKFSFVDANPHPFLEPFDRLTMHISYFLGKDSASWHPDVPVWGGVRYRDLYPGIDLELAGAGGHVTQRLVVHAGADLGRVQLRVAGADTLSVEDDHLRITTAVGMFRMALFQIVAPDPAIDLAIYATPEARGDMVSAPFDSHSARPFTALPQGSADLLYGTYLGGDDGSDGEYGYAIAVDGSGAAYITGYTFSGNFPTTPGAFKRTATNVPEAFVTKLNPAGTELIYSTFLGGAYEGSAIAVDASGAAYITGYTDVPDFPTTIGAYDRTINGDYDGFIVKLNATGTALVYSTFLGGGKADEPGSIAVDADGSAYVSGKTYSPNFPTTIGAYDRSFNALCGASPNTYVCSDAFVTKMNAAGSNLVYSTLLGGSDNEQAYGLAVDGSKAAYITGDTSSFDFPTSPSAYDTTLGGSDDAFVVKLNAAGSALVYATFLGGSESDGGGGIAVTQNGTAYVTGTTWSPNFPTTPGAFDRSCGTDGNCNRDINSMRYPDAFVSAFNPAGSALVYATFLGGSSYEDSRGIAITSDGAASVIVETSSANFPTTPNAFDRSLNAGIGGDYDAGVVKLNAAGSALLYATFLGGSSYDDGYGIAMDNDGVAYVTGETVSSDFPTTPSAFKPNCSSCANIIFVASLAISGPRTYSVTGRVRTTGGAFVSDVTINASMGHTTLTGSDGTYLIGGLPSDVYTLTPSKTGYTFTPHSLTMSVPPSIMSQDFTAIPKPAGPVYLPMMLSAPPPCNDVEPNDDQTQAQPLTTVGSSCIGSLQDDPINEDDWYIVSLTHGSRLTLALNDMRPGANYDLTLFRFDLPGQPRFDSTNPNQQPEYIEHTYTAAPSAQGFIRVRKRASAIDPWIDLYSLSAIIH